MMSEQAEDQNIPQGQITLANIMERLLEITENRAQDVASMATIRSQTEELRALLIQSSGTPQASLTPNRTPNAPIGYPENQPVQRKPLSIGSPFSGDKTYFRAWKVTMEHKLITDQDFIGDQRAQFAFIWTNLNDKVQKEVAAYYENGGDGGLWDPERFMQYLEFCYSDNHGKERAQAKLETIRQGKDELFPDFFVRFEQLLAQSGGSYWDDEQKLHKLRRSLNNSLRTIALHRGVPRDSYSNAVEAYKSIAVDLETVTIEHHHPTPHNNKKDNDGDVQMITVGTAKTTGAQGQKGRKAQGQKSGQQRATWIPNELFAQRRASDLCTRCGEDGHYQRDCPNALKISVAATEMENEVRKN